MKQEEVNRYIFFRTPSFIQHKISLKLKVLNICTFILERVKNILQFIEYVLAISANCKALK